MLRRQSEGESSLHFGNLPGIHANLAPPVHPNSRPTGTADRPLRGPDRAAENALAGDTRFAGSDRRIPRVLVLLPIPPSDGAFGNA